MAQQRSIAVNWLMKINLGCAFLSGIALLLMMVAGAVDVVGTNLDIIGLSSRPVPAVFEFMATMMVVSVFLSISLGQARRTHIRVEVVVNMLPRWAQVLANLIRHGLSAAFFLAIAWFGVVSALHSFGVGEYTPGSINFPVWPARVFLAVGASLITVQCIFDFLGVFWSWFDVRRHDGSTSAPSNVS
jgi:TRAP-type C4-dicarboxylate transport system permease small subunit